MRFDRRPRSSPSSAPSVGRSRPVRVTGVLAGQRVPTDDASVPETPADVAEHEHAPADAGASHSHAEEPTASGAQTGAHAGGDTDSHGGTHPGSASEGDHPHSEESSDEDDSGSSRAQAAGRTSADFEEIDDAAQRLGRLGLHEGDAYDAGDYALVFHSSADAEDIVDDVSDLESTSTTTTATSRRPCAPTVARRTSSASGRRKTPPRRQPDS